MSLNLTQLSVTVATAPASLRQRELEAGRLVLRAARSGDAFLARRAAQEARALGAGPARRALVHAVDALEAGPDGDARRGMVAYGAVLERHGLHADAAQVYGAVLSMFGDDASVALHAGRATRRSGDRTAAMRLYGVAAAQARGDETLELMAAIGVALIAEDPVTALAPIVREARRARRWEAYAIAREERARLNRSAGRSASAVRDLFAALRRYTDRQDRVRVLHALADVLSSRGDLMGAREALLIALDVARPSMRVHTIHFLRALARTMGDDLELRRSRGNGAPAMVMILPPKARVVSDVRSLAPRLALLRSSLPVCTAAV
ncbi:MAG: hypothetical protein ACYC28_01755 [Longimicrobiales bacterium]